MDFLSQSVFYEGSFLDLKLTFTPKGLRSLSLVDKGSRPRALGSEPWGQEGAIQEVFSQLDRYFLGTLDSFKIRLDLVGTDFQKRVWGELQKIPMGKTASYKEIAIRMGVSGASQAVGQANKRNPIPLIIPCHRVISSDGGIGGFSGGLAIKRKLLDHELKSLSLGVLSSDSFSYNHSYVSKSCLY